MGPNHSRSEDSGERESENDRANETDESSDRGRSRGQSSSRLVRKSVAEAHYGKEIDNPDQLAALQRLEQKYGRRVHTWLEEGMPMEAMGKPSKMEAFRQRKGTRVPWDIERQNDRSRRRNTSAIQRRRRERPDGDTQVPDSVRDVISSRGQSLEASVQRAMEDRMGESFDDVRVHTGPAAAQACESINARAFTVGNHVAFNRGEYDPESAEGQHVIAHELAHVRQQTDGAVSMLPQKSISKQTERTPDTSRFRPQNGSVDNKQKYRTHLQRMPKKGESNSDISKVIENPKGIPTSDYPKDTSDPRVIIPEDKSHFTNREDPHITDEQALTYIVENAHEVYTNGRGLFIWVLHAKDCYQIVNAYNQARAKKAPNNQITISTAYERRTDPRSFINRLASSKKLTKLN